MADDSSSFREEYLNLPNPKKPSTTRRQIYDSINTIDSEPVKPVAIWPHQCSLSSLQEWDDRRSERPEGSRFTDPPGYRRGDDYIYNLDKNKINWSAARIEQLRFENAIDYLHRIEAIGRGEILGKLPKDQRDAVHPNKFGYAMNLESDVQKRSDWRGELRPRFAKIVAQTLYIYENRTSAQAKLTIPIQGCEIKGYDAQAANTNPTCDLYGMGFTDDQAKRVICVVPSANCSKQIPIFIVLPTYEDRIQWLYTLKRKAEDRITTGGSTDMMRSVKGMLYNTIKGKKD